MARRPSDGPTDAEVEILHVLWKEGASTVQTVHDALNRLRPTGYTTALKLMQLMLEKGLLARDDRQRRHVYRALITQEEVQGQMVGNVLNRVFQGSCENLVLRALQSKKVSTEELGRIRKLLDTFEDDSA